METRKRAALGRSKQVAASQTLSDELSPAKVMELARTLDHASRNLSPHELPTVLPQERLEGFLEEATALLLSEQNLVEIEPTRDQKVTVVGDTHGQFHDVLRLFEKAGRPSESSIVVFNGDFVDRGAWSVELYTVLLCWKLVLPKSVFLLRGNHETRFCATAYGFRQEVETKYAQGATRLMKKFLACFASHPLAARVNRTVFIAHGGLFREPSHSRGSSKKKGGGKSKSKGVGKSKDRKKHKEDEHLHIGRLQDLMKAKRTSLDPLGGIPADVLWSDPGLEQGLVSNDARGIGLIFGPDVTQEFLSANGLKLIIRSHEGPDAREKRPEMPSMKTGYSVDHTVEAGCLVTVFSAPDYPQFQPPGQKRLVNSAAFLVLRPPDFSEPEVHHFEAVLPRPQVNAYYDVNSCVDSDEDLDLPASGSEADEMEAD